MICEKKCGSKGQMKALQERSEKMEQPKGEKNCCFCKNVTQNHCKSFAYV